MTEAEKAAAAAAVAAEKAYALYLDERKGLIDAARESARTFDQAVLAFGSAVFGFSVVFLKDIAPKPALDTLKWLGVSWLLFSLGLLAILLSFLFSHRACLFGIEDASEAARVSDYQPKTNPWGIATTVCNFVCIGLLFLGLLCWSVFAYANLSRGDTLSKVQTPTEKKDYLPTPPSPAKPGVQQTPPPETERSPGK
jgi:hypothetical protein